MKKTADMKTYMREYMRAWRDDNRERVRSLDKQSRDRNADERAARRARPERRANAKAATAAYRARLGFDGRKNQRLLRQYGITLEAYRAMREGQNNCCPICERGLDGLHPHVDHDHATGAVRAILCGTCNQAVGMLYESPSSADRLAEYLRKHGK